MRLYVGNLNYRTTEEELHELFSEFGEVEEVAVVTDRETGRPRGFAFVTMKEAEDAQKAIESLDGQDLAGRTLNVNEARPRGSGGGGGGGYGGGGGGRGGFGGGGGGRRGGGGGRDDW